MRFRKILVLGNHSLLDGALSQYKALGDEVRLERDLSCLEGESPSVDIGTWDEVFIAFVREKDKTAFLQDSELLGRLTPILSKYDASGRARLLCQILLHSPMMKEALWREPLASPMEENIELYPFTFEGMWAEKILSPMTSLNPVPGGEPSYEYPPLDREKIDYGSTKRVHLVIFGCTPQGEALAVQAAHLSHFPNFTRDENLKSRITIISPDIRSSLPSFAGRFHELLRNSWTRIVDATNRKIKTTPPLYDGIRREFTDIEWEFVEGSLEDVRLHLEKWACDPGRLMTIALCEEKDEDNLILSMNLPECIREKGIPVLAKVCNDSVFKVRKDSAERTILPFGMDGECHDVTLPLRRLAMYVNYIYGECYMMNVESDGKEEENKRESFTESSIVKAPTVIDREKSESLWNSVIPPKRYSSMGNASSMLPRMRSLGHGSSGWGTLYSLDDKEVSLIAKTEHNRWSVEELMVGYRPPTEDEKKLIDKDISLKAFFRRRKIHYDLCAAEDLGVDATGKRVDLYDICLSESIPLILSTFYNFDRSRLGGGEDVHSG